MCKSKKEYVYLRTPQGVHRVKKGYGWWKSLSLAQNMQYVSTLRKYSTYILLSETHPRSFCPSATKYLSKQTIIAMHAQSDCVVHSHCLFVSIWLVRAEEDGRRTGVCAAPHVTLPQKFSLQRILLYALLCYAAGPSRSIPMHHAKTCQENLYSNKYHSWPHTHTLFIALCAME